MSEIQIINARSAEKIEFLLKEVIKLNLQIKDLQVKELEVPKDNILNSKSNINHILTELNKKNVNWDSLPVVLF